jgi:hypothetical protein
MRLRSTKDIEWVRVVLTTGKPTNSATSVLQSSSCHTVVSDSHHKVIYHVSLTAIV